MSTLKLNYNSGPLVEFPAIKKALLSKARLDTYSCIVNENPLSITHLAKLLNVDVAWALRTTLLLQVVGVVDIKRTRLTPEEQERLKSDLGSLRLRTGYLNRPVAVYNKIILEVGNFKKRKKS